MPALDVSVAESLVMDRLEGLPGDPKLPGAYRRLRDIVIELAVSVDHARAALELFDERFPSPHDLKEGLANLLERFQPPATLQEQIEKWKSEGATYDPDWTTNLLKKASAATSEEGFTERHKREHMAIVDEWRKEDPQARRKLYPPDLAYAEMRRKLGFTLTPWDEQVLDAAGKRTVGGAA